MINKENKSEKEYQITADEDRESKESQNFFAEKAFNGTQVECTPQTAAHAQNVIKDKLRKHQVSIGTLFSLLFRNNLATDPNAFIPKDSPLLKPIDVEQFNKNEAERTK